MLAGLFIVVFSFLFVERLTPSTNKAQKHGEFCEAEPISYDRCTVLTVTTPSVSGECQRAPPALVPPADAWPRSPDIAPARCGPLVPRRSTRGPLRNNRQAPRTRPVVHLAYLRRLDCFCTQLRKLQ